MSYLHMDHAGWMESNNTSANALDDRRRLRRRGTALPAEKVPEKLTNFQKRVVDILGIIGGGIYNAPICDTRRIEWDTHMMSVTWKREMATFDFNTLTWLVFLCHEARIRCAIEAVAPRLMRISFWPREDKGEMWRRHPNLDEAVAQFKASLPADHRITYRSDEAHHAIG